MRMTSAASAGTAEPSPIARRAAPRNNAPDACARELLQKLILSSSGTVHWGPPGPWRRVCDINHIGQVVCEFLNMDTSNDTTAIWMWRNGEIGFRKLPTASSRRRELLQHSPSLTRSA